MAPPFAVEPLAMETRDGEPIRGWWAEVDLAWPGLEVLVTQPLSDPPEARVEARLAPTDQWARDNDLALAINANFFGVFDKEEGTSDVMGLSVSDGRVVSPARAYEGVQDPVLVFGLGKARAMVPAEPLPMQQIEDGVAGIGASSTDPDRGGLLVDNGQNLGATARVAPDQRHPRTAAGVNRAGDRLMLVVIDGRQPDWSVGIKLPELAQLMIDRGVYDAVALDGGGSSAFYFDPAAAGVEGSETGHAPVTNRPSDGAFRPVANSLGFRVPNLADED